MKRRDFFKYTGLAGSGFIDLDSLIKLDLEKSKKKQLKEIAEGLDEFAKAGLQGARAGKKLGMQFKNGRVIF